MHQSLDYIGNTRGQLPVATEVTFSCSEAAAFLGIPVLVMVNIMKVPGLCPIWERCGRVSETTVRKLYAKLYAGATQVA